MALVQELAIDETKTFRDFGLDEKLVFAMKQMKWERPTAIQATVLPLALKGKDILARSNTGTGKTAAYALPILQRILRESTKGLSAVVVVPTPDLCQQVEDVFKELTKNVRRKCKVVALLNSQPLQIRIPLIKSNPNVIISTPQALFQHLQSSTLDLSTITSFVIDEADIVLSDCQEIGAVRSYVPLTCQMYMLSATLTQDVMELKKRLLNAPFVVKLDGVTDDSYTIQQTYLQTTDAMRYVALYGMLRVGEINGKTLIFVNSIDNAFKLQIVLEMFRFKVAVLNSEVPENSRNHIVRSFNEGIITHLIATDESLALDDLTKRAHDMKQQRASGNKADMQVAKKTKKRKRSEDEEEDEDEVTPAWQKSKLNNRAIKVIAKAPQQEYGVHRGVDFQGVAWVVNFDCSSSAEAYTHRIGRTGRAGRSGRALSFFLHDEAEFLQDTKTDQEERGKTITEHPTGPMTYIKLEMRIRDVLQGITKKVLSGARAKGLAQEILNSEQLKNHFAADPLDMRRLTHIATHQPKSMSHSAAYIWDVPRYMGLDVKSAVEIEKEERQVKMTDIKSRRITARSKTADSLTALDLGKARKAEKKLSEMELRVMDPEALRKRRKDQKSSSKIREWIAKYGRKTGRHGQRQKLSRHHQENKSN